MKILNNAILVAALFLLLGCVPKEDSKGSSGQGSGGTTSKPQSPSPKIVCDRFQPQVELKSGKLHIKLDTDLPDYAEVFVMIYRGYVEKGRENEQAVYYLEPETSSVKSWKAGRVIPVSNEKWIKDFEEKLQMFSKIGEPIHVVSISQNIKVSMSISSQSDPRFGKKNENLIGKAVSTDIIQKVDSEVELPYPIKSSLVGKARPSLDPKNLDIGPTYILSRETPLMPGVSLDDPHKTGYKIIPVQPGSSFVVLEKRVLSGNRLWYRVRVPAQKGKPAATGWFYNIALIGQDLKTR